MKYALLLCTFLTSSHITLPMSHDERDARLFFTASVLGATAACISDNPSNGIRNALLVTTATVGFCEALDRHSIHRDNIITLAIKYSILTLLYTHFIDGDKNIFNGSLAGIVGTLLGNVLGTALRR